MNNAKRASSQNKHLLLATIFVLFFEAIYTLSLTALVYSILQNLNNSQDAVIIANIFGCMPLYAALWDLFHGRMTLLEFAKGAMFMSVAFLVVALCFTYADYSLCMRTQKNDAMCRASLWTARFVK